MALVVAAAVLAAAAIQTGLLRGSHLPIGGVELTHAALLLSLIAAGRLFPIPLAYRRRMVTDTAPLFAAALLLEPWLAALVSLLAVSSAETICGLRTQFYRKQVAFNTSQAMLGVIAASAVFSWTAGQSLNQSDARVMLSVGCSALAMLAVSDLLVFSVVWAQLGLRFSKMLPDFVRGRSDIPYDIALYGAGFVAALIGAAHPWLLILLVVPLPTLYRAMSNQRALHEQTRDAVIALADTVDDRDPYTFGHCKRVAEFSERICNQMGLAPDVISEVVLAARVHDVGKIGIRDAVLLKPGRLTDEEFAHIKEHPDIGARLTARFPDFAKGTRYIRHHHEKWDGTGYPSGLKAKEIPLGARIIAVADTYDAMTSTRVYRAGLGDEVTRLEMARVAGQQLDPEVVRAWFVAQGWTWPAAGEQAPDDRVAA
ncbi:hypothetical protein AYO38_01295 [bacterium SCGC AG-212-C10]|nr:hypothetical protein AYO38_01295 [bacterium SCGC AG-212-C10]